MIRNFLFHRVHPERDSIWDPMSPSLFEKSIAHIRENYDIITAEDLLYTNDNRRMRFATISFDDGYRDNVDYALPVLEKYKIKASFYVVTDCIKNNSPTWNYVVEYLLLHSKKTSLQIDTAYLPEHLRKSDLKSKQAKRFYAKKIIPELKKLSSEKRKKIIEQLSRKLNDVELPGLMMSWKDVEKLNKLGHRVGSHTVTHAILGSMKDEQEIEKELLLSGKEIEKRVGHFPSSVSYPIGSYNPTVIKLCKKCGYKLGLTVDQRIYNPKAHGIFEVPRIELYNEAWWKTKMRISNSLEDIKKIIGYRKD